MSLRRVVGVELEFVVEFVAAQQRGQTGSLYGNNPFEQPAEEGEEGEQQPQDTTKKERKIRKPLESYFFSDSIRCSRPAM